MSGIYDVTGIDPVKLLQALYRNAPPGGGKLSATAAKQALEAAENDGMKDFADVAGRPIRLSFTKSTIVRAQLYDAEAGEGACARAVAEARRA
jgi:hypothetical protein